MNLDITAYFYLIKYQTQINFLQQLDNQRTDVTFLNCKL
jgi:hypothetical protein